MKKGLTLITYSAVNRLTHHFQDPNSVARSNLITDTYTYQNPMDAKTIEEHLLTPRVLIANLVSLGTQYFDADKRLAKLGADFQHNAKQLVVVAAKIEATDARIEATDAKLEATDAKIDATDAKFEAKIEETKSEMNAKIGKAKVNNGASLLDRDQLDALNGVLSEKNAEYHKTVNGMIIRDLKLRLSLGTKDTYKCIASRDFEYALQFCKNWIPSPKQMETLRERIEADEAEKRTKKEAKAAKKKEIPQQAAPQPETKPMQVTKPIESRLIPPRSGGIWQVVNPPRF